MDKEQLISVIVPVYNTAPWLRRCLDSICAQTYRNLEILCVNDGSTDNSAEILAEFSAKDSRVQIIEQQNAGVSAARNKATAMAQGDWVAYVDSDDWLTPDIFGCILSRISDEVDMVSFGALMEWESEEFVPENANRWFTRHEAWSEVPCTPEISNAVISTVWGKLWRRSVIVAHDVHSPVGLRHEDDAFVILFMRHCRSILFCPKVGYHYLQRAGSFMHEGRGALKTTEMYVEVVRYVMHWVRSRGGAPCSDPWCCMFVNRVYEERYHVHWSLKMHNELTVMFYRMLVEQGLLPVLLHDYRFRRIVPVRGWRRLFLSRYLYTELWRFFGIPVWRIDYERGCVVSRKFVLWEKISRMLRHLFRFSEPI